MKLARVFIQEYNGRSVGDIHDVIDSSEHPGSLLTSTLAEVPVSDTFDKDRDLVNLHSERWTKGGEPTVYADPTDETFAHETDGPYFEEISDDSAKVATADQADLDSQVAVKYGEMTADVLADMKTAFGTEKPESASAHYQTWQVMVDKPELFSGESLVADKATGTYALGDALDTDLKVATWGQERLDEAEAYGVTRAKRIKQFADEKAAILGA